MKVRIPLKVKFFAALRLRSAIGTYLIRAFYSQEIIVIQNIENAAQLPVQSTNYSPELPEMTSKTYFQLA